MRQIIVAALLALSFGVHPAHAQLHCGHMENVTDAPVLPPDAIAAAPTFAADMATLSDADYLFYIYCLIDRAFDQNRLSMTAQALQRQGVPASQTCAITRAVMLDRGM